MDQNVKNAQRYLNAMFGGHSEWVELEENGNTGSLMMEGLIRAFQINNGISPATGFVGPRTIAKMKVLPIMERMDPDDDTSVNAALVQAALFAKGYNAGGITGIFYNAGVRAVRELQSDAGLYVTGTVNWKVWAGLFSMNWFKKVSRGDETVRLIQRQLNSEWSDIIGVGPCDGVASRQTILSLVGALQAAEGVTYEFIEDLNELNFGPSTTRNFPGVLRNGQNGGNYTKFNKLVQYGLYFNGYNPGRFDGVFDGKTESQVRAFQEFYALLGTGRVTAGEVNVSTMKSLLTSKGDTERSAKACDCATVLNRQQALDLKAAGYTHVGRYLTGSVGSARIPKFLTLDEIKNIENAGLSVFALYQDGGYYLEYFQNKNQGLVDGRIAIEAAMSIGLPEGATIYFAVDFDAYEYQVDDYIIPYFQMIKRVFNSELNKKGYTIGVYGARMICTKVSNAGLATYSFVGDMSTGFSGNLGHPIPRNWAFDQFYEEDFPSSPGFPIDKDAYSGRDKGVAKFDTTTYKSMDELIKNVKVEKASMLYVSDVLSTLNYFNDTISVGYSYDSETFIGHQILPMMEIDMYLKLGAEAATENTAQANISITRDHNGGLSVSTENEFNSLSTSPIFNNIGGASIIQSMLDSFAATVKSGNISVQLSDFVGNRFNLTFVLTTDDLLPDDPEINETMSLSLRYEVTLNNRNINPQFQLDPVPVVVGATSVALIAAALAVMSIPVSAPVAVGGAIILALSMIKSNGESFLQA